MCSGAKRLQQLVTGLELTADRGSAWGQLASPPITLRSQRPQRPDNMAKKKNTHPEALTPTGPPALEMPLGADGNLEQ
ncbi:hypothetical protein JOQ06_008005 [Pogonophryne albipinna]|uniref:Uncharacterized protein n=1 Tax=Pogonophryne albipinna TaxID=1090488 RepID=A0AAD6AI42_9TELE|nr:hypothetical protein JOQ06_008005 [Pogonophryne albipinna]